MLGIGVFQSMGVYLYGEMMLSGCKRQRDVARHCLSVVGEHMETGTHNTVNMMLYGEPARPNQH